jgi:hypothetical protein
MITVAWIMTVYLMLMLAICVLATDLTWSDTVGLGIVMMPIVAFALRLCFLPPAE